MVFAQYTPFSGAAVKRFPVETEPERRLQPLASVLRNKKIHIMWKINIGIPYAPLYHPATH